MNYNKIILLYFAYFLNVLSLNDTENIYTNNILYQLFPCFICDVLSGSFFNYTYDALGTFQNSSEEKIFNITTILPVTSTLQLSSNYLTTTDNDFLITTTIDTSEDFFSNIPQTSFIENRNTTPLIIFPSTPKRLVNPFLIKLYGTTTMNPLTLTPLTTTSNSTNSLTTTTAKSTVEKIMNVPMYSFLYIENLISDIESNLTINIIDNINGTTLQENDKLINSINSQIKQLFESALSIVKSDMYLKNITFINEVIKYIFP